MTTLAYPVSGQNPAERCDAPPGSWSIALTTALLALPALLFAAWPAVAAAAVYERAGIEAGEWWRLFSGHWTHWSPDHLRWDLLVFAVLLPLCMRVDRGRTFAAMILAGVLIPLTLWVALPDMVEYRGLSGLDATLYVLLAGTLLRDEWRARQWRSAAVFTLALIGFVAKVAFEVTTDTTLFVAAGGFEPVPLAHAVGGACGMLVALTPVRARESIVSSV